MSRIFRTLPVLMAVLLFGFTAQAQEEGIGFTGKGIKLGAGWGSFSTNDSVLVSGTTGGFAGGAFLTYNINPRLAIQAELMYVQKGTGDNNFLFGDGYKIGYLEFPVLLKYNFPSEKRLIPSVFIGPAVSTLLSAEIYQERFLFADDRYDVKDGMKSMDFGLVFGGEVAFKSTRAVKFFLDLRYTLGLVNIIDPEKWNENRRIVDEGDFDLGPWTIHWTDYDRPLIDENAEAKNRVFTFLIGMRF